MLPVWPWRVSLRLERIGVMPGSGGRLMTVYCERYRAGEEELHKNIGQLIRYH